MAPAALLGRPQPWLPAAQLLPGNAQLDLLGDTVADFLGQAIVELARAQPGGIGENQGRGRGHRYGQPHNRGEREPCQCGEFEDKSVLRPEMPDHAKGQQEDHRRRAGQNDECDVNGAVQALLAAAIGAVNEVLLVIGAHLRSDTGDVVPPTGEYVAYNRVNTKLTHRFFEPLEPDRLQGRSLRCQQHTIVEERSALSQGALSGFAGDLRVVVLL